MHRKRRGPKCKSKRGNTEGLCLAITGKLAGVYILTLRVSTEFYTIREKTRARGERGSSMRERSVRRRTAWFCVSGFGPRRAARGSSVTRMEEGGSEPHAHGAYKMTRGLRASGGGGPFYTLNPKFSFSLFSSFSSSSSAGERSGEQSSGRVQSSRKQSGAEFEPS